MFVFFEASIIAFISACEVTLLVCITRLRPDPITSLSLTMIAPTGTSLLLNDEPLIGYAADGFEILYLPEDIKSSWQLKKGNRKVEPFGKFDGAFKEDYEFVVGSGDLDECNGKFVNGKYKYFATETFPFFPRCHWGKVSKDFIQKRKKRK